MYTVLHNSNHEIHGFWPKALQIHGFFEKKIFYYIGVTSRNTVLSCTDFFWNQKPCISRPCCKMTLRKAVQFNPQVNFRSKKKVMTLLLQKMHINCLFNKKKKLIFINEIFPLLANLNSNGK